MKYAEQQPLEQSQNELSKTQSTSGSFSARTIIVQSTALAIAIVFVLFLISLSVFAAFANSWVGRFLSSTDTTRGELVNSVKNGLDRTPISTNNRKNFLLLGSDELPTRDSSSILTDTIMLVSLNLNTGSVRLLSFPRDLWLEPEQTRINSLYYYGQEKNPNQPLLFPTTVMSELTQVPIHHTILITMNDLEALIDQLGGVAITIETGFTDTQFPRTDVDVTIERDPAKLYETIVFEPGVEHMSGKRALQYMRSRHASGDEGTDTARAARQQQVVAALLAKVKESKSLVSDPEGLGELFMQYSRIAGDTLPVSELVATGKQLFDNQAVTSLSLSAHSLSIATATQSGAIVHPPTSQTANQWVYTITDLDLFRAEVKESLDL